MEIKKLDRKFKGAIYANKDGRKIPDDQWIILLAKDDAVPATLQFYRDKCKLLGVEESHITAVSDLINRVEKWREQNVDLCRLPDTDPDELIVESLADRKI